MAYIQINDIQLFYEIKGCGQPLLFLHGNDEDHHTFDPLIDKLSKHYTCYAIDSRNHGLSDRTTKFHYQTMMEDILIFITTLGLIPSNIIGFSDGSIIAMLLAMEYPNLVNKIILLGPNLQPSDFTDACTRYVERLYRQSQNPLYKMMLEEPDIYPENLHKITANTLIIGGSKDLYKEGTFEKIQNNIKSSELLILEGHDHSSYIFQNNLIYEIVNRFLK